MKKHSILKRALSLLLALVLVVSYLPIIRKASAADATTGSITGAYGETGNKYADPHTLNNWKKFFDIGDPNHLNTAFAGGVWTDKSVFNTVAEYLAATDEADNSLPLTLNDPNHFLVALSAIASTKSVEGYSSLPTDTILVLDLSASMVSNQAVGTLVSSANDAITRLQNLNANNRVGVVAYSGRATTGQSTTSTAEVILPLGRYTPGVGTNNRSAYLVANWVTGSGRNQVNHTGVKVANGVTGVIADGVTSTFSTNNAKDAEGGTYIQNGLYQAWEMFEQVKDTRITDGIQAGVGRIPVMVLMSDGAATAATTNYTNIGASNVGNGTSTYATNGVAFMTQLTASWVRDKMQQKYESAPLFYTLGLNVGSNAAANNLLDPSHNTGTDRYWNTFTGLTNGQTMSVSITGNSNATISYTAPVGSAWSENYVTEYFPASNASALGTAFSDIVQQIIVQSLYYPTMVEGGNSIDEDGFLVFDDYIGKNMEVAAIKGIQLGSTLYTGQTLAKMIHQGGMGTQENPTDAGNNLLWSVQARLGIDDVTVARQLLNRAYSTGQLFYDPNTGDFSNYIGWYADENEKFVGFWDGKDASPDAVPAELKASAKFAVKSYGFYDAVGEGHRETDMMYAAIQVRTTLRQTANDASHVGDIQLIGKLPASLIPLVEYDVDLNGTNVMAPTSLTTSGATCPIRLLYEVGLSSKIDLLDIAGTAPDPLQTDENGNYVFYTNQWHARGNFSYTTNKNTLSYFEPSFENERYYYNYDTPIYLDTNGTLYTGTAAPTYSDSNTYYHRFITYYKENGAVRAQYDYEPISEHVLSGTGEHAHLARLEDNTWVVKRGTLHHYFADYQIDKLENTTDTLDVSFMPFVHDLDVSATSDHFHVDFYLGNNGKLTLNPTEGIRISKVSDDTLPDKSIDYRFTVTTENTYNAQLRFVKQAADGTRTESTITFTEGNASLTLKHGESAWILGADMAGKTFRITEDQGDGYVVSSVNGVSTQTTAALTVTSNAIPAAEFVNTRQQSGTVVIGKGVTSSLPQHQNKEFSFTVTITGSNLVAGREYTMLHSGGQTLTITPDTPTTVTLKHNEYVNLAALPAGTTVAATEHDYSDVGFTVNQATQTATVEADTTKYLNFGNTYASSPVTNGTTVTVSGIKHLQSDVGLAATFRFKLERYIYADSTYAEVTSASVTYQNEKGDKTFSFNFTGEPYTAAGTYYYRISEVRDETLASQGVIFDANPAFFSVIVSDDGNGNLYISDVVAGTDASVTGSANTGWNVTTEFTNTYAVNGAAKAVINIQKKITGNYGVLIPPAGFSFHLYEADADFNVTGTAPVATSPVTGAGGMTDIQLVFDDEATDIGTHYYVLKEHIPANNDKIPGVTYNERGIGVKVEVGHENGHFTLRVTTYSLFFQPARELATYVGQGTEGIVSIETDGLVFTNIYTPEQLTASYNIHKTLLGKDLTDTAFQYEITEMEDTGNGTLTPSSNPVRRYLSALVTESFRTYYVGTYYWRIREVIPDDAVNNYKDGITYDPSEFIVKVDVTGDNQTGKLSCAISYTKDGVAVPGIEFVNRYTAEPVSVELAVSKHLDGNIRKLQAGAFQFRLKEDGGPVVEIVSNGVPTDDYNAPVNFSPLTFTEPGSYRYIITEVLPDGATNQNNYIVNGVKYSTKQLIATVTVTDNGSGKLVADVQYGSNDLVFTNEYSVSPTSFTLNSKKLLTGDKLSNHSFTFDLYAASWDASTNSVVQGALIATKGCDDNGNFSFSDNFDAIGAYRYILREHIPDDADVLMHYDTTYYIIEVGVTDDLHGGLVATPKITKVDPRGQRTEVNEVTFHNVYDPVPVKVDLGGIKIFNLNLPADAFSFELYQALNNGGTITAVGDPILTAHNKADGTFTFEEMPIVDQLSGTSIMSNYLSFSQAGTYYFVVKENIPEGADENNTLNGVTYDATVYTITVTVTQSDVDGRATLSQTMTVDGQSGGRLIFTNSYNAVGDNGVTITGKKYLSGKDLTDGEFKFGLYHATVDDQGYVTIGQLIQEVSNVGENFTFSEITYDSYTDDGYHFYVVREILPDGVDADGNLDGITYDKRQYLVGVQVSDNGDGTMSVFDPIAVGIQEDGRVADYTTDEIFFRNVFTEEPADTGDYNQPVLWGVMFGMSILALGAVLVIGKKKLI